MSNREREGEQNLSDRKHAMRAEDIDGGTFRKQRCDGHQSTRSVIPKRAQQGVRQEAKFNLLNNKTKKRTIKTSIGRSN